jgi:hypothetical protein
MKDFSRPVAETLFVFAAAEFLTSAEVINDRDVPGSTSDDPLGSGDDDSDDEGGGEEEEKSDNDGDEEEEVEGNNDDEGNDVVDTAVVGDAVGEE